MSIYLGNNKINNVVLKIDGSFKNVTNVIDLGIIPNNNSSDIKSNNTNILKQYIDRHYDGSMCFYFPIGKYYFNLIEITENTKVYDVILLGETRGNRLNNLTNNEDDKVIIYTEGTDGFINRTNTNGETSIRFTISHIAIIKYGGFSVKPTGVCIGALHNSGGEYNITLYDTTFMGYEYGFYSPGFSCYSNDNNFVICAHCKYGIYISKASHMFRINHLELNYCKYGLRLDVGGTPCSISDVHVAVGLFSSMEDYYVENPLMYGIHCKSSVVIDGIYFENYAGDLDLSNYYLIHYEGFGGGGCKKVKIKNCHIETMRGNNIGKFFYGRKYIGQGLENKENPLSLTDVETSIYFLNGCVDFENCIAYDCNISELLSRTFDVSDNGCYGIGYTFDGKGLYKDGVVISNNYIRKFKSSLDNLLFIPEPNSSTLIADYSYNSIPNANRIYNGVELPMDAIVDNAYKIGVHYKGRINIKKIENASTNVILGIVGNNINDNTKFLVRELVHLNSEVIGKDIIVDVDEFIPITEAKNLFFGYKCVNSVDEKITNSDTSKIVYEIESIIDEVEYSKDVGVSRSRAYFKI